MADKRNRSSTASASTTTADTPTADVPALLTNGGIRQEKVSIPAKPNPPSKPFKLTRAFSGGSVTLPAFGKKTKKKSKSAENTNPENKDDSITPIKNGTENGNEIKMNGVHGSRTKEEEKWKLPGIMEASGKKLKYPKTLKAGAVSDSTLLLRELPPIPDQGPDSRELLGYRELPPLPHPEAGTDTQSSSPHLVTSSDARTKELGEQNKTQSTSGSGNEGVPTYVNVLPLEDGGSLPPLPETPPNSEDADTKFRPLPQSPPLSDYDDDEEMNSGEAAKLNQASNIEESNSRKNLPDTSPELLVDETGTGDTSSREDGKGSPGVSNSSLIPDDPPTAPETEIIDEPRDYTIGEIVGTYSYALPVCVKVLQGYCSDTTEVNISTDDVYNIHSVQHIKKVMVKDEDGMTHRISLEAPVKMGLVYNPKNDYDTSLSGYNFRTISEATSMPVLPKVISATQGVNCSEEKNSVSEGEIFIVKNLQRSLFKGKKGLKVYSLSTNSNKVLFDDCQGHFSTKPSLVRMDLPELLERVTDIYPSRCVIYPTTDDVGHKSDFPGELFVVYK